MLRLLQPVTMRLRPVTRRLQPVLRQRQTVLRLMRHEPRLRMPPLLLIHVSPKQLPQQQLLMHVL